MKAYKKILSLLLALVMIVGVLPMGSLHASAADMVWKQVNTSDSWKPENGHKYILVAGNASKALTSDSAAISQVDVTISGRRLTASDYNKLTFTYNGSAFTNTIGGTTYYLDAVYGWGFNSFGAPVITTAKGFSTISVSGAYYVQPNGTPGVSASLTPSASTGFRIFEEVEDNGEVDPTEPEETEPSQFGPSNLPLQHMVTGFWHNFDNGSGVMKLSEVPDCYDMICVAFADATANPGEAVFNLDSSLTNKGYSPEEFKQDIKDLNAKGRRVVLSIGGEKGMIYITSADAANNFANSIIKVCEEWGFNGIDIDLEGTAVAGAAYMSDALHRIDSHFNGNFILTLAPEIYYFTHNSAYVTLVNECADIIDVIYPQFYNGGGMNAPDGTMLSYPSAAYIAGGLELVQHWCPQVRDDQMGIGMPATSNAASHGYLSTSEIENAINAYISGGKVGNYQVSREHATLRSMMTWSINWDATSGYAWGNAMSAAMDKLPSYEELNPTEPVETDPPETDPPETDPPVKTHQIDFWATVKGTNDAPLEGATGLTGAGTYNDGEMVTVTAPLTQTVGGKEYKLVSIGFRDESLDHSSPFYTWMYEGEDEGANGKAMREADRDWSFMATYEEVPVEVNDQYLYISLLDKNDPESQELLQFQDRFETFQKLYAPGTKVTVTAPETLESATTQYRFAYWADPFGDMIQEGRTLEVTISADETDNLYNAVYEEVEPMWIKVTIEARDTEGNPLPVAPELDPYSGSMTWNPGETLALDGKPVNTEDATYVCTGWYVEQADGSLVEASFNGHYYYDVGEEEATLVAVYEKKALVPETKGLALFPVDIGTDETLFDFQNQLQGAGNEYLEGQKVTVTAPETIEAGDVVYRFVSWNTDITNEVLSTNPVYVHTMSSDAEGDILCAMYKAEPVVRHTVTVSTAMQANDGTAAPGGATISATSVKEGESVTATAKLATGYDFIGWFAAAAQGTAYTGTPLSTSRTYTFAPKADTKLVAVYKLQENTEPESVNITVVGLEFTITVDGKTSAIQHTKATRKLPIGTVVTVNCADSSFVNWQSEFGMILSKQPSYTFTVLAPATYTAANMDTAPDTALVEFISDYNQVMACFTYTAEDEIEFPDGPGKVGYIFDGWNKTQADIQKMIASGEKHIVVSPTYRRDTSVVYDLTVFVDGAKSAELSKTDLPYGENVLLKAPAIAGKQFKCWASDAAGNNVLGYASSYFVKMLDDTTIYAVYANEGEAIDRTPTVTITPMAAVDGAQKITTSVIRNVPEGYTMVEHGVVFNKDGTVQNPTDDSFVIGGQNVNKAAITNDMLVGADTPTISIADAHTNTTVYVRGYLIVKNPAGETEYYYTDIVSGVYNVLKNG